MKKLLSLILAMVLLLSLASCGNRGNESSNIDNSYVSSEGGNQSTNHSSGRNEWESEVEKVEYTPPQYKEPFDPNRQTLTRSEYETLYNAIVRNDIAFPGTDYSYKNSIYHIDLRNAEKVGAMAHYIYSKYEYKQLKEEELLSVLKEKFDVTEYDIYLMKTSYYFGDTEQNGETYYSAGYNYITMRDKYFMASMGHCVIYDDFMGYRDMGENKYEFYFAQSRTVDMCKALYGVEADIYLTEDQKKAMNDIKAQAVNGAVVYEGKEYVELDISKDRFITKDGTFPCYRVITLEYKDGNVRLVDTQMQHNCLMDLPPMVPAPTTFSKIPTE